MDPTHSIVVKVKQPVPGKQPATLGWTVITLGSLMRRPEHKVLTLFARPVQKALSKCTPLQALVHVMVEVCEV